MTLNSTGRVSRKHCYRDSCGADQLCYKRSKGGLTYTAYLKRHMARLHDQLTNVGHKGCAFGYDEMNYRLNEYRRYAIELNNSRKHKPTPDPIIHADYLYRRSL
jgi:hypothetical protein